METDPDLLVISTIDRGEAPHGPHVDYQKARRVTAVLDLPEFRRFVRREASEGSNRVPVVGLAHDWFGPTLRRVPRRPAVLMTPIEAREANQLRRLSQPPKAA